VDFIALQPVEWPAAKDVVKVPLYKVVRYVIPLQYVLLVIMIIISILPIKYVSSVVILPIV
jgi:hypothetical protein